MNQNEKYRQESAESSGRAGDPISFGNLSFNEVLGDLGKIKVPPKPEKKPKAKPTTGG